MDTQLKHIDRRSVSALSNECSIGKQFNDFYIGPEIPPTAELQVDTAIKEDWNMFGSIAGPKWDIEPGRVNLLKGDKINISQKMYIDLLLYLETVV
jgi:hypothetical protein